MSKRWMGVALLCAFLSGPAVYAAETSGSGSIFQVIRQIILDQISAMIPPTGLEGEAPPPPAPGTN